MANPTRENGAILKEYVKLARKLGKLPSSREVKRFICDPETIKRHFGSFNKFKEIVLSTHSELNDIIIPSKLTFDDLDDYKLELERKKVEKSNKVTLENLLTADSVSRFIESLNIPVIKPHKPMVSKKPIKRALSLTLSDLHFGADIRAEETGYLTYGPVEEARRFAEVIKQTIEYKPHYRLETELHINLCGDLIQHKLHDPQAAAPVSEQICRAIHLLSQGFAQIAESFPVVNIRCATGNHGRDLNRHQKRATTGKWDSVETIIYYSLKKILSKYKNIKFDIPKTPFVIYNVMGHKAFTTHGDTVLNVGNPGKSLNIKAIENQVNQINASLKDKEEIKLVFVGHTHCASVSNLNSGTLLVTNGSLPPSDDFAVSLGYLENRSSQTLIEITEKHAVGDIRFIRVDAETDKDVSLDKIIKPYEGFND